MIGGDGTQGLFVNDHRGSSNLYLPVGYVSGEAYEFTAFIENTSFADLGFEVGDQSVVTWENDGVSERLVLNYTAVPEPGSTCLLCCVLFTRLFLRQTSRSQSI